VRPLQAMEVLLDRSLGPRLPLPRPLQSVCGPLRLARPASRPYVIANFASTLDGVVSWSDNSPSGGAEVTGSYPQDRLLMGVLRAAADVVVVGAGTFRAVPRHVWSAPHVAPGYDVEFAELRRRLGKAPAPLNVIVTARGDLDLTRPLFASGEVPVVIVTTRSGARRLASASPPRHVRVRVAGGTPPISSGAILRASGMAGGGRTVLVEGGPHLLGSFLSGGRLDELFLTLAPQVAGRRDGSDRPGLVSGRTFAPADPRWAQLVGVRRSDNFLFLRFTFPGGRPRAPRGGPPRKPRGR
jgi:riboflavin biosynthesis pyrimidine reductase